MTVLWWTWVATAAAMLGLVGAAGSAVQGVVYGALIDNRGRCSLARFQILWWTMIVFSLVAAVIAGRFTERGLDPLAFTIPSSVLGLLGVVVATTVTATGIKAHKNARASQRISASPPGGSSLAQMFLSEEGSESDETIDVSKLQSFIVTLILGAAYVLTAVHDFLGRGTVPISGPRDIASLPDLDGTFLALLAISGGGYAGAKLLNRYGLPSLSLAQRDAREATLRAQEARDGVPLDSRSIRRRRRALAMAERATIHGDAPTRSRVIVTSQSRNGG